MSIPRVSVLMNCFNGARYLRPALESIFNQTMPDWELLFWDNQSTDESASIVSEYRDVRIRYLPAPAHTNLGEARRQACAFARGEWVGVLDTDDLWLPKKLESQLQAVEAGSDFGMVYSRCEEFGGDVARIQPSLNDLLPEGDVFSQLARGNFISLSSLMYRRDAMTSAGGFQPYQHAADYDLSLRVARENPVAAVDGVYSRYRIHETNASHRQTEVGLNECLEILSKHLPAPAAADGIRRIRAHYACWALRQRKILCAFQQLLKGGMGAFCRMSWDRLMRVKQS